MTPSDIERFTSGAAIGVDVAAIERDLAALWRRASAANAAVTRACSWNLVVHATGPTELERATALADAVVAAVPSRTLVLDHRPTATTGPEIEAFVTANCRMMSGGHKLVCAEEITMTARGRGDEHLPSLVRALLVPDLPTAILWAGTPPRSSVVDALVADADRVILDSAGSDGLRSLARVGAAARVADLDWLRVAPLRAAVASAFDDPDGPAMLRRLTRVTLRASSAMLSAARLLLGWLADRLHWGQPTTSGPSTARWSCATPTGPVSIALELGGDAQLDLCCEAGGGRPRSVRFDHEGIRVTAGDASHRIALHPASPSELVVAALGRQGHDETYRAALDWAVGLEP